MRTRYSENAESKARPDDLKSTRLVNSQASLAPCSRSMPLSSHSIESGTVVTVVVQLADDLLEIDAAMAERAEVPAAALFPEVEVRP